MKIGTNLDRLERLIHQPVSSRPDWLKHAREDAQEVLWLAHRAANDQDYDPITWRLNSQSFWGENVVFDMNVLL